MRIHILSTLLVAGAFVASAQGYKDGIQYYTAGDLDDAQEILLRTFNDAGTDRSEACYYLGAIALEKGDKAAAKKRFDEGIAANAEQPLNYVGLGQLALSQGDKSSATPQFKQAQNLAGKNAAIYADIARAYFNADPTTYAKEIDDNIAQARKKNKKEPAIYILEADREAAKNVGNAAGLYEMAMNMDKEDNNVVDYPGAFIKYARTYFPVNPQYSIKMVQDLLEALPTSAMAQRELAEQYYENNQLTMAAEQYGKYIQNPNHFKKDEQRYVGLLYFGKKYQESFDLAQKILKEDPSNFYMQRMLFLDQAAMENYPQADEYAKAFFANPKAEFVTNDYTTYGEVLHNLGQDTLAVAQYEKAVELAPDKAGLLVDLSTAYDRAKMYPQAAAALQKYVDSGEASTNDILALARRYQNLAATSEEGSPERAAAIENGLKYAQIAVDRVPDHYLPIFTKARILYIRDNNDPTAETVEAFQQTLNVLDADPANLEKRANDYRSIYNLLGGYYMKQKDTATAKTYYQKFLDLDPENEDLRKFVEGLK
ncbi:MAG: hypothetical protein LIP02_05045 [Bacteroidales bacterium]|nr:hypothetical protein [Bacteroidales bacterium]